MWEGVGAAGVCGAGGGGAAEKGVYVCLGGGRCLWGGGATGRASTGGCGSSTWWAMYVHVNIAVSM